MFSYEINYRQIDEVLMNVRYSISKIRGKYHITDDVEIQIPNYFLEILQHQNNLILDRVENSNNLKLFGCKISNSPDHCIRVFNKDFPKLNLPPEVIDLEKIRIPSGAIMDAIRDDLDKKIFISEEPIIKK